MKRSDDTYVLFKKGLDLLVYGHILELKTINKMGKVDLEDEREE